MPVSLACLCWSLRSSSSCRLTTSRRVAGVLDTCCTHSWPFSVHSLKHHYHHHHYYCHLGVRDSMSAFQTGACHQSGRPGAGIMEANDRQVMTVFTVQLLALDKPSIMKCYHHRQMCSHTSPRCLLTMVMHHDTQFVEYLWWNAVGLYKTVVT